MGTYIFNDGIPNSIAWPTDEELCCALFHGDCSNLTDCESTFFQMAKEFSLASVEDVLTTELGYKSHTEYLRLGRPQQDGRITQYDSTDGSVVNTETHRPRVGEEILHLTHKPVQGSGLRIWVDSDGNAGQGTNPFPQETELTIGEDFYLDLQDDSGLCKSGMVYLKSGSWPMSPRNIKATYFAGYQELPAKLKYILIKIITHNYGVLNSISSNLGLSGNCGSPSGILTSESFDGYSYSVDAGSIREFGSVYGMTIPPQLYAELVKGNKSYVYMR